MTYSLIGIVLFGLLFPVCSPAQTQELMKIPRVGLIVANRETTSARELRRGFRDLGYVDEKNIKFEYRYSDGMTERIADLVTELIRTKVDVLVLSNFRAIRAAKKATKTIPVVMVTTQDPVETGLIDSLARPGTNLTGLTRLTRDLSGKRLELLREVVPTMSRTAVLWDARRDIETSGSAIALQEYEIAAPTLKLQLESLAVQGPNPDFDDAFRAAKKARVGGLGTIHNAVIVRYQKRIAELALTNWLPSMFEGTEYVTAGGLMSYATNDADLYRRAATYVDKILKGAKPADLPVEQPTKFELVINMKTAKQIGLTIPPHVLARADRVIK